jgi:outer membrane protein assembly factor BamB
MRKCAFLFVGLFLYSIPSWASEKESEYMKSWPQWRGPEGTGVAPFGDPPVEWGEEKNLKWKIGIPGEGHASPIVWGDRIFILTAIAEEKAVKAQNEPEEPRRRGRGRMRISKPTNPYEFVVMAVDRLSGKRLWQETACEALPHEGKHGDGSFASNSPVTDGERVYAHFGSRGLYCYDMEGKLLWKEDFGDMAIARSFGEGSSPALHDDTLVVIWDHEGDSFIAALDKKTGEKRWKKERDEATSWATPLVVEHDGRAQVITNATNRIRGYDLATGKVIWECGGMTRNAIPCPVTAGGVVYVMSGFRGSALLAIDLKKAVKDITDSEAILWKHGSGTPYVPSPLLYADTLYFHRVNEGILSCFDRKTGDAHFTGQKLEGLRGIYASPVGAKERVYLTGRNGVVQVIERGSKYKVLASNTLDDDFSASPAIAGRELFLRGHKHLYCVAQEQ